MKVVILPNDEKSPEENIKSTMTRIGGIPILLHTIMLFEKYGFSEFYICDNSRTHEIRDYLNDHLDKLENVSIRLFKLPPCLKSSRILSLCQRKGLEDAFFVAPNDVITDINIEKMLSFHRQNARAATVCVAEEKRYFVGLGIDDKMKCESKIVNSGFYIFENEAIDYMSPNSSLDRDTVMNIAENDELSIYSNNHFVQRCI